MAYVYNENHQPNIGQLKPIHQRTLAQIAGMATRVTTLENAGYQNAAQVQNAINAKIASVYKPGGSKTAAQITDGTLNVAANEGVVYNLTTKLTLTNQTKDLFVEGAEHSYPVGANVVVIKYSDTVYGEASGTADDGTQYYSRSGEEGSYVYTPVEIAEGESVLGYYIMTSTAAYRFDALPGFVDLSGYTEKVSGGTAGNFVLLAADGSYVDAGFAPATDAEMEAFEHDLFGDPEV